MRWMIVLLLVLLAIYYFLPEQEPPTAEESFIGPQVQTLRKAEGYEDQYLKAAEERKQRMERELEESGG